MPSNSSSIVFAPSTTPQPPPFNEPRFILTITIVLLAPFALFAVLSWPRLFTRFSRGSEWTRGHFVYHSTKPQRRLPAVKRRPTISSPLESRNEKSRAPNSDDDHTAFSHIGLVRREDVTFSLPPHCRSWSGIFQRLSAILGYQLFEGRSLGRSIVLLCYFGVVLFALLYKSNPFRAYPRAGFVTAMQIPIVFALATKNNVFGRFLSTGYERLNHIHRFAGTVTVVTADLHALGFIYKWTTAKIFMQMLKTPSLAFGFFGLIAMNSLFFFSTPFWRRKFYNIFLFSHILGAITLPICIAFHAPVARPWLFAAAGAYGVDRLVRVFKTRISTATIRPIPELGMTRIEIPNLNAGWRPGQHVRLRVLSTGVGILGWTEIHPFTVASVNGDGLTLMVKKAGDWTNKLYDMATRSDAIYSGGWGSEKKAKVWIEGPYGGVGNTMMDSYSGAVFVAGGSGITFALSSIADLVQKDVKGHSRLKIIHLVWSVQDAASLQPMIPTFAALLQQVAFVNLYISVHYTRASTFNAKKVYAHLHPRINITPGRPKFVSVVDSAVDYACKLFTPSGREQHASDKLSGVFVGVCGPSGLGVEVRKAVGAIDPGKFRKVGGIEVFEETFGW